MLRNPSMPMGGHKETTRRRQADNAQYYKNECARPLGGQIGIGADGISLSDGLAHLSESEPHARVLDDDPLGIRQRGDGEDVGQKEKTAGNHRQFIHIICF